MTGGRFPLARGAAFLLLMLALAPGSTSCAKRASGRQTTLPSPRSGAIATTPVKLPPGVIARAHGKQGVIAVEDRRGSRVLTIDGVVQGGVRAVQDGMGVQADPMVHLVTALSKEPQSALVIGLGTGRTVTELAGKVPRVEAVELEPLVARYAREHFAYQGHVAVMDGLEYLRASDMKYDLILMDAFSGLEPVPHLVSASAIRTMQRRLTEGGVIAMRMNQVPGSAVVKGLLDRLPYSHVYGDGLGGERQNLYLVSSRHRGALNVKDRSGIALRPIRLPEILEEGVKLAALIGKAAGRGAVEISLVGYLIREQASGALALDLSHQEMGAVRYLLSGKKTRLLESHLSGVRQFPTLGGIPSDGDTASTLRPLLGGGGSKRSDCRHSPVVVALRGKARLISVSHPDWQYARDNRHRRSPLEPRIPWGGVLYALEVTEVLGVLPLERWRRLQSRDLAPLLRAAASALARGDLASASEALVRHQMLLRTRLSKFGPLLHLLEGYREVEALASKLNGCCNAPDERRRMLQAAVICDESSLYFNWVNPEMKQVFAALRGCAEHLYSRLSRNPDAPLAPTAAARLMDLWRDRARDLPEHRAARLRARIGKLNARFGGKLEPRTSAPKLP